MKGMLCLMSLTGLIFLSECRISSLFIGDKCRTPNGLPGVCYNIMQCPSLLELLQKSRINPDTSNYLRKSVCSYDNFDSIVCCPNTSTNQPRDPWPNRPTEFTETPQTSNDSYPKLLSPPHCGFSTVTESIDVRSQPQLRSWPWIAALGFKQLPDSHTKYCCGGSLITNKHIITAAHCTQHHSLTLFSARLGDLNIDDEVKDYASPVEYEIASALAHPDYHETRHINDIAILYLKGIVEFNDDIKPICLPKSEPFFSSNFETKSPFIAGWGAVKYKGPFSTHLLEVQVPIVPNKECQAAYEQFGVTITPNHLCAGYKNGGKDACLGDSGGPMILPDENEYFYYLIGIISFGHRCAEPGYPGVYVRTAPFLDWINNNI